MHNLIQIGTARFPRRINQKHTHDTWEIVYYLSGRGVSRTARESIPFSPGTLIAYPPHTEHDELSRGAYASYWMRFHRFTHDCVSTVSDDAHGTYRSLLGIICREYLRRGGRWRMVCDTALDVLLAVLGERVSVPKRPPHVQAMEYAIVDSIHDGDFSARRAFASIGMSQHYLIRSFKRAFGVSPVQYRIDIQMRDAERLLTVTDLSVREIAKQLGFRDAYYFSRLFKRKCGVSPMACRRPSAGKGNANRYGAPA
ncbi:MAG: AraC family transcriptional regulator [Spirochaetota bacterium]